MILHSFLGDTAASKVLVCAAYCQQEVKLNIVRVSDLKMKEYKKKLTFQRLPILDIDEHTTLGQSNAIVRYIAKLAGKGLGDSAYQQALTDQWLYVCETELEGAAAALIAPLHGTVHFDKAAQKAAQDDFLKVCNLLEAQLAKTKYLTGEQPTVADYSIFSVLASVFRVAVSFSAVQKHAHLKAWLEGFQKDAHVIRGMGKVAFCAKPFAIPPIEADDA